jgi:hypothetical protein
LREDLGVHFSATTSNSQMTILMIHCTCQKEC